MSAPVFGRHAVAGIVAIALARDPKVLIAEKPTTALEVTIQAQVVNLLEELQDSLGLTHLFISHDLSMVRHIADRVAVMYLGRIVELASHEALYETPLPPYTQALLSTLPEHDPNAETTRNRIILKGDVPAPANPPKGCNFSTRCPKVMAVCRKVESAFIEAAPGHFLACHLYQEAAPNAAAMAR